MAYTLPTHGDVKVRFPELSAVPDQLVADVIAEAARQVDNTWLEGDYATAIKYLTAHILVMGGALAASGGPSAVHGPLSSISLGDASESYESLAGYRPSIADAELASTSYGRRFMALRLSNVRGAVIV